MTVRNCEQLEFRGRNGEMVTVPGTVYLIQFRGQFSSGDSLLNSPSGAGCMPSKTTGSTGVEGQGLKNGIARLAGVVAPPEWLRRRSGCAASSGDSLLNSRTQDTPTIGVKVPEPFSRLAKPPVSG
jgi:hypothetical protein